MQRNWVSFGRFALPAVTVLFFTANAGAASAPTQLGLDTPTAGTVESGQTVRYSLAIPSPGQVTLQVTGWVATLNWTIDYDRAYMYNSAGDPVWIEEFGTDEDPYLWHMLADPIDIVVDIGEAGDYFVDLHSGERYDDEGYPIPQLFTITASVQPLVDPNEVNDSLDAATLMTLGESTQAYQWRQIPTSVVWNDEDWYAYDIPSPVCSPFI